MCNKNNAAATGHRNLFFLPDFTAQHFLSYSSRSTCLFLSYPPPAATSQWEMQINKSSAVGKFSLVDLINPEMPRCSNPECTPGAINNYLQKGIKITFGLISSFVISLPNCTFCYLGPNCLSAKLSWCQIVLVPNSPSNKLFAFYSWC